MTRGSRYVHQWNEGTDLSKDLSKPETGDFLIQYTKIEPKNMEKHIIHVVSAHLSTITKTDSLTPVTG